MASVWVIEEGDYSGYRVIGVFSSRENAERVLEVYDREKFHDCEISEWPLDPWIDALNHGHSLWQVQMKRNGDTESVEDHGRDIQSEKRFIWRRTDPAGMLEAWVYAKDEKHAVKIVNEIRSRMIANNEWE